MTDFTMDDFTVEIACTVEIPTKDCYLTIISLLDEIESALQRCKVAYKGPDIRNVPKVR